MGQYQELVDQQDQDDSSQIIQCMLGQLMMKGSIMMIQEEDQVVGEINFLKVNLQGIHSLRVQEWTNILLEDQPKEEVSLEEAEDQGECSHP